MKTDALRDGEDCELSVDSFTVYLHDAEEGGYWAEVPALPGCVTEGDTLDGVVANINEAVRGWLGAQTPESLIALGIKFTCSADSEREESACLPRLWLLRLKPDQNVISCPHRFLGMDENFDTNRLSALRQTARRLRWKLGWAREHRRFLDNRFGLLPGKAWSSPLDALLWERRS